jgi:hypothetical protein
MWWAPWRTTRPWLPRFFRGTDEWHNRSVAVVVPFLGTFILFVGPFDRSGDEHLNAWSSVGGWEGRNVEDCPVCIEMRSDPWTLLR